MNIDESSSFEFRDYWDSIVRRKWIVIITLLTCTGVAGLLCIVLPKSYRSSTLILVENPKTTEAYVKDIGGASVEERLTMVHQQVMSRTMLSQIMDEFSLYGANKTDGLESKIEKMRAAIKVDIVGTSSGGGKSVEAFVISFAHRDPVIARNVTARLASHFIEKNTEGREQLVTGVSTFLEQELQAAKAILEDQEQAISKFKTRNIGLLPEQMEANLKSLDRLQTNLNATDELLRSVTDRLSLVEKSIREYEASGTTVSPAGQTASHAGIDPLMGRLRELEKLLTSLRAEYTESYPDIGEAKKEIESLRTQLAAKYRVSTTEKETLSGKTFDPYLRELIKQRDELRVEATSVRDRRQRLAEQINEFENRVEQTPAREQELMILIRDYKNMQSNYQSLLEKRLNAHVAENLEKRKKGEQFRIIDPANLPEKAEKPNFLIIMAVGLLGGAGLGVVLAIGLEQINPTFLRREAVEMLPGLRVLAAIPDFSSTCNQLKEQITTSQKDTELIVVPANKRSIWWSTGGWHSSPDDGDFSSLQYKLIAKWQPRSIAAEQYRVAATRLTLFEAERTSTVLGVTSALKGEGKTTTVVNLGYTMARDIGKRTLLIDCDFRCPGLHKYAHSSTKFGLMDLLDEKVQLEECLSRIDEAPCFILSAGNVGAKFNEFLKIQQLSAMLPMLRMKFDYVLINAPPVLPVATMNVLAGLADLLILVIRAGTTPKNAVEQALGVLRPRGETQVILNAIEAKSMPSYMYGYSPRIELSMKH